MIKKEAFGTTLNKEAVTLYIITNKNGMSASVTDFGAILVNLCVPDADGKTADVVLGINTMIIIASCAAIGLAAMLISGNRRHDK